MPDKELRREDIFPELAYRLRRRGDQARVRLPGRLDEAAGMTRAAMPRAFVVDKPIDPRLPSLALPGRARRSYLAARPQIAQRVSDAQPAAGFAAPRSA